MKQVIILVFLTLWYPMKSQVPATLSYPPNPVPTGAHQYLRASTQINLDSGFVYGPMAIPTLNHLLNFKTSTLPAYVNNNYQDPASDPNYYAKDASLTAAVFSGAHDVDNSGGFSYHLPIFCSPGTTEMEPEIAIVYNSNGRNTVLGMGFDLTGLSAITRTGKNLFYDNVNKGVKFDANDVFLFDGQRLLLKGSGTYGQNGTTYKTFIENHYSITFNTSGGTQSSFIVTTPDGITMEYGTTTNSRNTDVGGSEVLGWYINKVYDVYGNYITYTYNNSGGEFLIDRIDYTGNSVSNFSPYNAIRFTYMDRSDDHSYYVSGKEFKQSKILKEIICSGVNGALVRKYTFDYIYKSGTLLNRITEVDALGNQLNPTYFEWRQEGKDDYFSCGPVNPSKPSSTTDPVFAISIPADLNGDGKKDLLLLKNDQVFEATVKFQGIAPGVCTPNPNAGLVFSTQGSAISLQGTTVSYLTSFVLDEDDDDIDEVFIAYTAIINNSLLYFVDRIKNVSGSFTKTTELSGVVTPNVLFYGWQGLVLNSQSAAFNSSSWFFSKKDITGDNVNDLIFVNYDGIMVFPFNGSPFSISATNIAKAGLGDFDGDGVLDLYTVKDGGGSPTYVGEVLKYDATNNTLVTATSINLNTGYSPNMNWSGIPTKDIYANAGKSIDFGDFNSDGKTDILHVKYVVNNNVEVYVLKSNGTGFLADNNPMTIPLMLNSAEANFSALDVNNDGYSDLSLSSYNSGSFQSAFDHYPYDGKNFNAAVGVQTYNDKLLSAMGDFDGDGALDYAYQNSFSTIKIAFNHYNQNNGKLVSRIFNIKNNLQIKYAFLPGRQRHGRSNLQIPYYRTQTLQNTAAQFKNVVPRMFVTTELNNNEQITEYAYENYIFHRAGLGFLGFEKKYERLRYDPSSTTNIPQVVSSYFYDPANDNLIKEEVTRTSGNGNTLYSAGGKFAFSETGYNYTQNGSSWYLASETSKSRDYLSSTRSESSSAFDINYGGKPVSQQSDALSWTGSTVLQSNLTTTTYQSLTNPINSSTYFRNLKVTASATKGGNTSSYDTDFAFDGPTGRLLTILNNSNITNSVVTVAYSQHNVFGTPRVTDVTGTDFAARKLTVQFDATGRFITQSTDILNNTESAVYDPIHGTILEATTTSGLVSKFEYDGIGRLILEKSPTGAINRHEYNWYSYTGFNQTCYGLKTVSNYESNGSQTLWYDNLDNQVRSESSGFGGNTVVAENTYDRSARLLTSTEPHFQGQSFYRYYDFTYDAADRLVTAKDFGSNSTLLNAVNYGYNTLSTDATYNKGYVEISASSGNGSGTIYHVYENNEVGQTDKVTNYINVNSKHHATYSYNEHGLPTQVVTTFPNGGGGTTSFQYDALGRKNSITDPSAGVNTFAYSSMGELTASGTSNGNYTYEYDALGRIVKMTGSGQGVYQCEYFTSGGGRMQLKKITGPTVISEYSYDVYGRPTEKKENLGSGPSFREFKTKYVFDKYNRLTDYTYPGNFMISNEYDANGLLTKIKNANSVIWELTDMKTPMAIEKYKNHAGTVTQFGFNNAQRVNQVSLGSTNVQNYVVQSATDNLLSRSHQNNATSTSNNEGFDYDSFDRLVKTTYQDVNNATVVKHNYTYNANGALSYKEDCGSYVYGIPGKPYTVSGINSPVGNISLLTLNVTNNDFNKVSQITEGSALSYDFVYGNDGERIKMEYRTNSQLQYTRYYQDNYDREETANSYREWSYIYSPSGLTAVYYNNNGTAELLDVNCDNLGSPLLLTNASGQIVEEYSFDAWGRRRNPADWNDYVNVPASTKMIRGYTGHEHLDEVGLINMNGRMYDPVLAQFLQADPFVQDPTNIQNMNRYSYVLNNPLRYTDPSGYKFEPPPNGTMLINEDGTYFHTHAHTDPNEAPGRFRAARSSDGPAVRATSSKPSVRVPVAESASAGGANSGTGGGTGGASPGVSMRTEDSPPLAIRIRNFERYIEKTVKEALSPLKAYDEAAVKQDGAVHKTMKAVADLNPIVGIYNGGNYAFGDKTTMFGEQQSSTSATAGFVLSTVPGAFLLKWSGKAVRTGGNILVRNATRSTVVKNVAAKGGRALWTLTKEGASAIKNHKTFGTIYKSNSDGLWWAVDKAGHGGSKFKVFKEGKGGLEWFKDADEFGDFIINKHKGSTGTFIPWGQLSTVK